MTNGHRFENWNSKSSSKQGPKKEKRRRRDVPIEIQAPIFPNFHQLSFRLVLRDIKR